MELSSSQALGKLGDDLPSRHAAAAVVGMRDAYRSFQAEVAGHDTLKLGLREGKASTIYHRYRQQGEPRALA